jgi:hypothetical protein
LLPAAGACAVPLLLDGVEVCEEVEGVVVVEAAGAVVDVEVELDAAGGLAVVDDGFGACAKLTELRRSAADAVVKKCLVFIVGHSLLMNGSDSQPRDRHSCSVFREKVATDGRGINPNRRIIILEPPGSHALDAYRLICSRGIKVEMKYWPERSRA